MKRLTTWLAALLWAAACSGDGKQTSSADAGGAMEAGGSTEAGDANGLTAQTFAAKARAVCQKIVGCCTNAEITNLYGGVVSQQACETLEIVQENQGIPIVQPDLAAGRRIYRADKEETCVAKLTAQSCAEWAGDVSLQRIPECFQIFEGTTPDGQPCDQGLFCVGGRCDKSSGSGVCAKLPVTGEACAPVAVCAAGLMCLGADGGPPATCGPIPAAVPAMCDGR